MAGVQRRQPRRRRPALHRDGVFREALTIQRPRRVPGREHQEGSRWFQDQGWLPQIRPATSFYLGNSDKMIASICSISAANQQIPFSCLLNHAFLVCVRLWTISGFMKSALCDFYLVLQVNRMKSSGRPVFGVTVFPHADHVHHSSCFDLTLCFYQHWEGKTKARKQMSWRRILVLIFLGVPLRRIVSLMDECWCSEQQHQWLEAVQRCI